MSDFSKVASALARQTRDTDKDRSTDLDIAQASHALKVLKEIASADPELVARALKLRPRREGRKPEPERKPARKPARKLVSPLARRRKAWLALRFSTAYSRYKV